MELGWDNLGSQVPPRSVVAVRPTGTAEVEADQTSPEGPVERLPGRKGGQNRPDHDGSSIFGTTDLGLELAMGYSEIPFDFHFIILTFSMNSQELLCPFSERRVISRRTRDCGSCFDGPLVDKRTSVFSGWYLIYRIG